MQRVVLSRLSSLSIVVASVFAAAAPAAQQPATPAPVPNVVESVRAHHQGLAAWWMGNAGWLVKSDEVTISFDLELGLGQRVQPPIASPEDLASEIDVAFVSHHHTDHCNPATIRALARGSRTSFVLPSTCVKILTNVSIPPERLIVPRPLSPFDLKGLHVEPIHAIHGNQEFTVLTREPDFIESMAANCGYVVTIGGKRVFHPGDSVLTEEHLGLKDIDVLFVSPTVHNMYLDRSVMLINHLEPKYIFPQHYGTYRELPSNLFWTRGYPAELKDRLSMELQKRFRQPQLGEKVVIQ